MKWRGEKRERDGHMNGQNHGWKEMENELDERRKEQEKNAGRLTWTEHTKRNDRLQ